MLESGTASATAVSPCQTTSAATGLCRQGVLGRSPKAVVWVEATAPAGHPGNGGALAPRRLPVVLGLAVSLPRLGGLHHRYTLAA